MTRPSPNIADRSPLSDVSPSSEAFENIHGALQADATERKNAIKSSQAIFAFDLKNAQNKVESWHIDLKDQGAVGRGKAPEGKEPDGKSRPLIARSLPQWLCELCP